jgi:hypothetical protein
MHASVVQALLSLQTVGVYWHPEAALQLSVVHVLLSLHVMGSFEQLPLVHASPVHTLSSLQSTPAQGLPQSGIIVLSQFPLKQVSTVQSLSSLQSICV